MAGIAAMAPAIAAGVALIGTSGYGVDPIVTPYGTIDPISNVEPATLLHLPAYAPALLAGFGLAERSLPERRRVIRAAKRIKKSATAEMSPYF